MLQNTLQADDKDPAVTLFLRTLDEYLSLIFMPAQIHLYRISDYENGNNISLLYLCVLNKIDHFLLGFWDLTIKRNRFIAIYRKHNFCQLLDYCGGDSNLKVRYFHEPYQCH